MQKIPQLLFIFALMAAIAFTTGCASVMSGSTQNISVKSNPDGAKATFYNVKNESVSSQATPCIVSLKRNGNYKLKIEKDDYAPLEVDLKRGVNGWYFGNVLFGGIIGLLIVDPATGAMWSLQLNDIKTELALVSSGNPSVVTLAPALKQSQWNRK